MKANKSTKAKLTAAQLARQEVAQLFDAMIEDRTVFALESGGTLAVERLDEAFEKVSDLLEAEHVKLYGPIKTDQDVTFWSIGMSAGYLVGVQVGLRLRGVS